MQCSDPQLSYAIKIVSVNLEQTYVRDVIYLSFYVILQIREHVNSNLGGA